MIPSYKEEVKITIKEVDPSQPLSEQVQRLQEQVQRLAETVDYINRERSRMKVELESLRSKLNREL